MKKFDTLYKRAKSGTIQYWSIMVTLSNIGAIISKQSGQLNTKSPSFYLKEILKGKNIGKSNETIPFEQARLEAESDWKAKHDDGYKTSNELGIISVDLGYVNAIDDTVVKSFEQALEESLSEFNTDASGELKPMLAPSKVFKEGKNKYPQNIERKLDGLRSLCVKKDIATKARFLSRKGKPYDTLNHLVDIIDEYALNTYQGDFPLILDGELYLHNVGLQQINRLVKKYRENQTEKIDFYIFDLPLLNKKQSERTIKANKVVNEISSNSIKFNNVYRIDSDEQVIKLHDQWVNENYEGAMLKKLDGKYEPGQRSNNWTKVKMFDDAEFKITGYFLGSRGSEDIVFRCICDTAISGYDNIFNVTMNGTREYKQSLVDNIDSIIGEHLTTRYFGLTEYGIPNLAKGKCIREND